MITTKNPYNNQEIKSYKYHSTKEVENILDKAEQTFITWKTVSIKKRTSLLENLANKLEDNKEEYANLMTTEMGKPISQSIAEIDKCIWLCDFYIKNAEDFLADNIIKTDAKESFISYDPLGVVLAVMP